jgi:hypothetical protein
VCVCGVHRPPSVQCARVPLSKIIAIECEPSAIDIARASCCRGGKRDAQRRRGDLEACAAEAIGRAWGVRRAGEVACKHGIGLGYDNPLGSDSQDSDATYCTSGSSAAAAQ